MRRLNLLLIIIIIGIFNPYALHAEAYVDGAIGTGRRSNATTTAFSVHYLLSIFDNLLGKNQLQIGSGLRYSSFQASDIEYTTADADLVADGKSNQIVFDSVQTNSINVAVYLQIGISENFGFGANIDLVGVGFGPKATGTYQSDDATLNESSQDANPTSSNMLKGGLPDIGQLNSEFFISYKINNFKIRGGNSHFFSEYTTENKLDNNNDRFRIIEDLFFVSIGYSFGG